MYWSKLKGDAAVGSPHRILVVVVTTLLGINEIILALSIQSRTIGETFSPYMIRRIKRDLSLSIESGRGSETSSRYLIHRVDIFG